MDNKKNEGRMPATKTASLLAKFPFLTQLVDREQIASIFIRRLTEEACETNAGPEGGRYWFLTHEGKVPLQHLHWGSSMRLSIDNQGEIPSGVAPSQVLYHMGRPDQVYYMIRFRAGEVVVYHAKHITNMADFASTWEMMYEVLEGWDTGM